MKKGSVLVAGLFYCLSCVAQQKLEYFTDFGKLSFSAKNKEWTGILGDQEGQIKGSLTDTVLTGKWKLYSKAGDIRITFNKDFSAFKAMYNHADTKDGTSKNWKDSWQGMRIPDTIFRKYQTPDGVIRFTIIGTQVEGVYPLFNGKIVGELTGTNFTGIWLQANRGFGSLKITFSPDFSNFQGSYNDYNFHPDKWGKWNGTLVK